mgnify:CR=1 FL=1
MEKIRSLIGMVSKKKFFSACKCYENNKYGVDYVKPQLCIDEESHLIFCDRCGAVIDPFAAMLMVAIFEERQNREWGRYAVFPERLANDHILSWSNKGDVVLDPFCGSGTTAKMAMLTGRKFIGFEISAEYCDIAEKRIASVGKDIPLFEAD